jgi:hypothetical protein
MGRYCQSRRRGGAPTSPISFLMPTGPLTIDPHYAGELETFVEWDPGEVHNASEVFVERSDNGGLDWYERGHAEVSVGSCNDQIPMQPMTVLYRARAEKDGFYGEYCESVELVIPPFD